MGKLNHCNATRPRINATMPDGDREVSKAAPVKTVRMAVGNAITCPATAYMAVALNRWPKVAIVPNPKATNESTTPHVQLAPSEANMQRQPKPRHNNTVAVVGAKTAVPCPGSGSPIHNECPEIVAIIR